MNTKKHELWDEDKKLFESMKGHYQSVNEENFFKNMQFKQEYECMASEPKKYGSLIKAFCPDVKLR